MNPDVVRAVDVLEADGRLPPEVAHRLRRVARRELVSVRAELRAVLYAGVLAVTAGASLLVYQNLDHIGPLTITLGLWTATGLAALFVARHMPPFSWKPAESPHLAFDYVLLLAVLLLSSALAYSEIHFTTLGERWPWHLLLVSLVAFASGVRGDSRVVFGLALSTFAAWRGVSLGRIERGLWSHSRLDATATNAILVGLLFVALGHLAARWDRKAHFEPVAVHMGWLLVFGAVLAQIDPSETKGLAFTFLALLGGATLASWCLWRKRPLLFGLGVLSAYVAVSALVLRAVHGDEIVFLWFTASAAFMVAGLLVASRRFGVRE